MLHIVSPSPTSQPTPQPLQRSHPGELCSDEVSPCEGGYCVGPFIDKETVKVGVCAPLEVGKGCIRACLGRKCRLFPGNCLKCSEGKKLKEGRCL